MNLSEFSVVDWAFVAVALFTVLTAAYAVFAQNIVRAVFSLLGTFLGVALIYGFLSADFLAAIQLLVYVGGILVLILFAVMLTSNISEPSASNRSGGLVTSLLFSAALLFILVTIALGVPWQNNGPTEFVSSTERIGEFLLREGLLAFEVLSVVLVGIVIGAVVIARWQDPAGKETGS